MIYLSSISLVARQRSIQDKYWDKRKKEEENMIKIEYLGWLRVEEESNGFAIISASIIIAIIGYGEAGNWRRDRSVWVIAMA